MCVEACPCDAIRMDTAVHPTVMGYRREDFIEDTQLLMDRSRVMAEEGPGRLMDKMLERYQREDARPVLRDR